MKQLFILLTLLFGLTQAGEAQKPELKFNKDGKFKIVQFTDVHYIHGNPKSAISPERINEVLDAEKPDLVIFTGDIIYGKPAEESMRTILNLASSRKIPFGITFGNHDDEQGLTRKELFDIIRTIPYNLTDSVPGVGGASNFILPLKSADGKKDAAVLYCIDSHAYSQIKSIGGYDYIKFDQINWYRENSARFTKQNGGTPLPSLAFFHIALPEYNQAAADETAILIGTRKEKACAPQLNSGMFTSMKEMGDILGVFVGHDHDDDYAVFWKGILLAYGRYTGGDTVYNNLTNGARVVEMTEGEKSFQTWIRLANGEVVNKISCPQDFTKKKD